MLRLVALALLMAGCATQGTPPGDVRGELEAMYDADQNHRMKLQELAMKGDTSSPRFLDLLKQQQTLDEKNVKRFKEIVSTGGWPKKSQVGEKGSVAAFLVVQHADQATKKQYLPLLKAAAAENEARSEDLALLEDRVLMGEGKKQRYGSQLQPKANGGWEFYPIEDEATVDERRKAAGLPPLAEYAKQMGVEYSK